MSTDTLGFMLTTLAAPDKDAFLAKCTGAFAKVAESQFDTISKGIAPHLRTGYKVEHLVDLKRRNGKVGVFKISFTAAVDDIIAMISEKDGKASGLLLK
jgi:hypothetical protein